LLTYTWQTDGTNGTLIRSKNGDSTTLLTGCDSLDFGIFQRNPLSNKVDQIPTTLQASNTKVIQISWICSRQITGTRLNTESVQTAKVVLRNQQQ